MILLQWEGCVDYGRDAGYSETKYLTVESLTQVGDLVDKKDFKAFECKSIPIIDVRNAVQTEADKKSREAIKKELTRQQALMRLTKEEKEALGLNPPREV